MHLHGHHAVVLARDGAPATGSPWWFDSLNVENGETYRHRVRRRQPGRLDGSLPQAPHAADGLVAHLMYSGVTTPYRLGGDTGNEPE